MRPDLHLNHSRQRRDTVAVSAATRCFESLIEHRVGLAGHERFALERWSG